MIKSNMLKKLSVAFSVLLMAGSLTACGGDEPAEGTCKDGQVNVGGGAGLDAGCYDSCTANTNCSGGKVCKAFGAQKLCVEDTKVDPNNMKDCEDGKVKVNYMGTEQCLVDCSSTACGANEECTTSGTAKVCTPKAAPTCADGEVETVFAGSTKQCFKTCADDSGCTDGKVCNQDDAGVNMICTPASELETLCKQYCSTIYGECRTTNCPGLTDMQKATILFTEETCLNGIPENQIAACEQRLAGTDGFAKAELALAQSSGAECTSSIIKLRQSFGVPIIQGNMIVIGPADFGEACGVSEPSLNKPCMADAECDGGAIQASCDMTDKVCNVGACQPVLSTQEQQSLMMGNPVLADGPTGGCGKDSFCFVQPQNGGLASSCLEECYANSDCGYGVTGDADSGSACSSSITYGDGAGNVVGLAGLCLPSCETDADCPAQMDSNGMMVTRTCGANRSCQATCTTAGESCLDMQGTCTEGKTAGVFGCQPNYRKPVAN